MNQYHIKFLHHFIDHGVMFIVIGGQARRLISPSHDTRDLDIWVRLESEDTYRLESAIIAWGEEHPQHTNMNLVRPLGLRSGVQICFPETDGVCFLTRAGEAAEIGTNDRVDILTSLRGLDFDECYRRADRHRIEGALIFALCSADLADAAALRVGEA